MSVHVDCPYEDCGYENYVDIPRRDKEEKATCDSCGREFTYDVEVTAWADEQEQDGVVAEAAAHALHAYEAARSLGWQSGAMQRLAEATRYERLVRGEA